MAKKGGFDYKLGYDTSKFDADSKKINAAIRGTNKEVRSLQQSLSIEYDTETFEKAQRKAREAVELTEKKVEMLKKTLAKMESAGVTDETREEYEKLQRELTYCETEAIKAKKSMEDIDNIKLERNRAELEATRKKAEELAASYTNAGQKLTSIGSKLSLLSAGLVAGGAAAYTASADKAESVSKAEVVFGDYIEDIERLTEISLKNYGIAKSTVYEWTSLFGDMATSMGFTQEMSAEMSTDLTERLADLISFKNISADTAQIIGKALYSGESEPLKNIGVIMNETTLKAYALAEGYEKAYTEMDQMEKLSVRFAYFMKSTSNASGDFSRTAASASNSVKVLQESLKETAEEFGDTVAPMITPVINNLTRIIQKISELDDGTKANIVRVGVFVATLGPLLLAGGKVLTLIGTIKTAQASQIIIQGAATAATNLDTGATNANTGAKVAATAASGNWIAAIAAGVAVLGAFAATSAMTSGLIDNYTETVKLSRAEHEKNTAAIQIEYEKYDVLIDKLEALSAKENKTAEEKEKLISIVRELNLGISDLNLSYNENADALSMTTDKIRDFTEAKKRQIELQAYEERALNIKKQQIELELQIANKTEEIETLRAHKERVLENSWHGVPEGSYQGIATSIALKSDELKEFQEEYDKLVEEYDSIFADKLPIATVPDSEGNDGGDGQNGDNQTSAAYDKIQNFKAYVERLDYWRNLDRINDKEYYKRLEDAANRYLSKTSSEYRDVEEKLYAWRKAQRAADAADAEKKAQEAQSAYENSLKTALTDFKSYTDEKLKSAKTAADAQIKLIDDEIAARERLREQDNLDKKLTQANAKLQYEADAENRAALQKEIDRLEADKAEADYNAQVQAKKAAINAAYIEAEANAQALVDKFAKMTGQSGYNYNPTTNNYKTSNSASIVNNFTGTTPGEVEAIIRKELKAAGVIT